MCRAASPATSYFVSWVCLERMLGTLPSACEGRVGRLHINHSEMFRAAGQGAAKLGKLQDLAHCGPYMVCL